MDYVLFQIEQTDHVHTVDENLDGVYLHLSLALLETTPSGQASQLADLAEHRAAYLEALDWFKSNSDTQEEVDLIKALEDILTVNRLSLIHI